jgi:hypothetical protein
VFIEFDFQNKHMATFDVEMGLQSICGDQPRKSILVNKVIDIANGLALSSSYDQNLSPETKAFYVKSGNPKTCGTNSVGAWIFRHVKFLLTDTGMAGVCYPNGTDVNVFRYFGGIDNGMNSLRLIAHPKLICAVPFFPRVGWVTRAISLLVRCIKIDLSHATNAQLDELMVRITTDGLVHHDPTYSRAVPLTPPALTCLAQSLADSQKNNLAYFQHVSRYVDRVQMYANAEYVGPNSEYSGISLWLSPPESIGHFTSSIHIDGPPILDSDFFSRVYNSSSKTDSQDRKFKGPVPQCGRAAAKLSDMLAPYDTQFSCVYDTSSQPGKSMRWLLYGSGRRHLKSDCCYYASLGQSGGCIPIFPRVRVRDDGQVDQETLDRIYALLVDHPKDAPVLVYIDGRLDAVKHPVLGVHVLDYRVVGLQQLSLINTYAKAFSDFTNVLWVVKTYGITDGVASLRRNVTIHRSCHTCGGPELYLVFDNKQGSDFSNLGLNEFVARSVLDYIKFRPPPYAVTDISWTTTEQSVVVSDVVHTVVDTPCDVVPQLTSAELAKLQRDAERVLELEKENTRLRAIDRVNRGLIGDDYDDDPVLEDFTSEEDDSVPASADTILSRTMDMVQRLGLGTGPRTLPDLPAPPPVFVTEISSEHSQYNEHSIVAVHQGRVANGMLSSDWSLIEGKYAVNPNIRKGINRIIQGRQFPYNGKQIFHLPPLSVDPAANKQQLIDQAPHWSKYAFESLRFPSYPGARVYSIYLLRVEDIRLTAVLVNYQPVICHRFAHVVLKIFLIMNGQTLFGYPRLSVANIINSL